ncbi:MAG: hypothetical protein OXN20_11770 [Gemmatimonadota bacterium]|nr:hypothetical protein [Gemmatimonadota bacterium]
MQTLTLFLIPAFCALFAVASAADLTHIPDKDFDTLKAAGNVAPTGIWSDGTTMWVADYWGDKIYAYNMRTKARDPNKEFNTLKDAGNTAPLGIWSDGATMWVVDFGGRIYAYNMKTKAHDPDKDFVLAAEHDVPEGIWSDGTTMWVKESSYQFDKIYAYNMRTKARDLNKDFNTLKDAGEQDSGGIWSDGTTMWVADGYRHKIYAYNMRTKARDPDKDSDLAIGNTDPEGVWSDGTTMWVVDRNRNDSKIYAYGGLAAVSDQGVGRDQGIQDFSMKIRGTRGNLEICVRDHDCEDGDEIKVDVDGRTIFSGEIDNEWDCYTLNVWAGLTYIVGLTALNGTGYKGDCSYIDANTGEIRVTGENVETQVWRHRGGKGSMAGIIVETAR